MEYTLVLTDDQAIDMMTAMARMPVDQIGTTYVAIRDQLTTQGYTGMKSPPPAPPVMDPQSTHPNLSPITKLVSKEGEEILKINLMPQDAQLILKALGQMPLNESFQTFMRFQQEVATAQQAEQAEMNRLAAIPPAIPPSPPQTPPAPNGSDKPPLRN